MDGETLSFMYKAGMSIFVSMCDVKIPGGDRFGYISSRVVL